MTADGEKLTADSQLGVFLLKKSKIVGGLAITAVFLLLAVRNVEWSQVGVSLASVRYVLIVPALLCTFTGYLLRAVRWQRILVSTKNVSLRTLFPTLIIGFAANNVMPARVGEVVRAYELGRREEVSKTLGLATIFVERVFDGLTLILIMALVLIFSPLSRDMPGGEVRAVEYLSYALFFGAALSIVVLILQESLVLRLINVAVKPLPERWGGFFNRAATSFIMGLQALRGKRSLAIIAGVSLAVWSLEAGSYYLILRAFDLPLTGDQTISAAAFLLVFVNLGIMVPSAPGYVGTYQFFAKMALGAFGVGGSIGFSVAIVSHVMQYVLVTALGLAFFVKQNLSFAVMREAAD